MDKGFVTKEIAEEYLRDVEPVWKCFWFHMHLVARNLAEFSAGLKQISDKVFSYHVVGQKNDFARWVHEVIGDSVLARELSSVATKEEAARITEERVKTLESVLRG